MNVADSLIQPLPYTPMSDEQLKELESMTVAERKSFSAFVSRFIKPGQVIPYDVAQKGIDLVRYERAMRFV